MPDRAHILVRGRVQGVFFRATTQRVATDLGLSGYVRNLPDGSVEIVAEGERDALDVLARWARHGPPRADVDEATVTFSPADGSFGGFHVR